MSYITSYQGHSQQPRQKSVYAQPFANPQSEILKLNVYNPTLNPELEDWPLNGYPQFEKPKYTLLEKNFKEFSISKEYQNSSGVNKTSLIWAESLDDNAKTIAMRILTSDRDTLLDSLKPEGLTWTRVNIHKDNLHGHMKLYCEEIESTYDHPSNKHFRNLHLGIASIHKTQVETLMKSMHPSISEYSNTVQRIFDIQAKLTLFFHSNL